MKPFILVNAILEIGAGILFLTAPALVPGTEDTSLDGLIFLRMYGAAALAAGTTALMIWRHYDRTDLHKVFLTLFSVFHVGVTVANAIGYASGEENCLPVFVLHGVLAIITIFFYTKHR